MMTANLIERELLEVVQGLTDDQKQTVLQYARTIKQPVGEPGWLFVERTRHIHIPAEDLEAMQKAIDEAFGQIEDFPEVDLNG
jgi:hypothetical protein